MSNSSRQNTQLEQSFGGALQRSERPGHRQPSGEMAGRRRDMNSFDLDLDRIVPDADQVRKSNKSAADPEIVEMSETMKDHGVLQALTVRYDRGGDCYKLIAGERRYQAAKLAGLTSVPVKLQEVDEKTAREIQVLENIQRADLRAVELGMRLEQMMSDDGETIATLQRKLRKSQSWVSKVLQIAANLSDDAKQVAESMSVAHLYEVSQLPAEDQAPTIAQIREQGMTVEELKTNTAELKRAKRLGRSKSKKTKPYHQTVKGERGITIILKARRASVTNEDLLLALRTLAESLDTQGATKEAA